MKKKGLIISTAVMVVVLIAALTTGTFAWFTQTATTKVEDINVSVEAGANLKLGVTKTGAIDTSATATNFLSGTVNWASSKWNGGDESLGYSLNTSMSDLKFDQAVYTWTGSAMDGSSVSDKKISDANLKHALATATGDGAKLTEVSDAKAAVINGGDDGTAQVLHLVIGLAAAPGKDVYGIKCTMAINVKDGKNTSSTLGMNAAMYYVYQVIAPTAAGTAQPLFDTKTTATDATGAKQGEFFTDDDHRNTTNENAKTGSITFDICAQQLKAAKLKDTDIYQLDLYIFINGWDEDCMTAAAGTSCAIQISFEAYTTEKSSD